MANNFQNQMQSPMTNQMTQNLMQMSNQQMQPQQPNYFLQPQGNIYMINSSNDTGLIPIGNGLSAGFCLADNTVFLKTFQNGSPMMLSYKLVPIESQMPGQDDEKIASYLKAQDERLNRLEEAISKLLKEKNSGGKLDWSI